MGSYLPAGTSGKRLRMQEGCRSGFAHYTKRIVIARFFDRVNTLATKPVRVSNNAFQQVGRCEARYLVARFLTPPV
jgi:hypothetical protein